MTFSEAYAIHGPDVEAIADALGVTQSAADRLINSEMERRHAASLIAKRREYNARMRDQLRGIRARRPA